jgi:hypothetical protein
MSGNHLDDVFSLLLKAAAQDGIADEAAEIAQEAERQGDHQTAWIGRIVARRTRANAVMFRAMAGASRTLRC